VIGQATIGFLDILILALLDEQPFHSAYSIAEALAVSPQLSWVICGNRLG
jgi:hypothetical protein